MDEDEWPPPFSDLTEAMLESSDPERVAEMRALRAAAYEPGCEDPTDAWLKGRASDHPFYKYREIEDELEKRFLERVREGELVLSAFTAPIKPGSRREVIFPELLDVIEINFLDGEAYGAHFKLIKFKVHAAEESREQEPTASSAVVDIRFTHNPD